MIAKHVTRETLETAARQVGVKAEIEPKGRQFKVKLYPENHKDSDGNRRYQRTSAGTTDRRVYAVCWHGFRDYFRAVYKLEPDAVFVTAVETWRGSDDFEARYRASGHRNVGSQMYPRAMAEVCVCPESGWAQ